MLEILMWYKTQCVYYFSKIVIPLNSLCLFCRTHLMRPPLNSTINLCSMLMFYCVCDSSNFN
uniref:Uncharacterized protein n=1 Tax=Arundo donax TaxID=35708 RepID=A0A0A9HNV9_ARUDO